MDDGFHRCSLAHPVNSCRWLGSSSLKTVNIYSLSAATWRDVSERLDRHITAGNVGDYYEIVFSELIAEGTISLRPVLFDPDRWYEIDTLVDLEEAERIFLGPTPARSSQSLRGLAGPRP